MIEINEFHFCSRIAIGRKGEKKRIEWELSQTVEWYNFWISTVSRKLTNCAGIWIMINLLVFYIWITMWGMSFVI